MVVKISISLTRELDDALECIALAGGGSKSHVIETYLREHPDIHKEITALRAQPDDGVLAVSRKFVVKGAEAKPAKRRK